MQGTISINDVRSLAKHFGQVLVPPGTSGSVEVRHIDFGETNPWPRPGERPPDGIYTELLRDSEAWMSTFPNEVIEQMPCFYALNRAPRNVPILFLGMGLGVMLNGALLLGHKGPFDIVEVDPDVLALMQPHWADHARITQAEVRFHLADAYTWPGAAVGRWAIGYADVWRDLGEHNLPSIKRLEELYAPRCLWYSSWSKTEGEYLKAHRESGAPPLAGIPIATRVT